MCACAALIYVVYTNIDLHRTSRMLLMAPRSLKADNFCVPAPTCWVGRRTMMCLMSRSQGSGKKRAVACC